MKSQTLLLLSLLLLFGKISIAQTVIGNWKGTSLCQIKNSACHDEIVVYHISKTGKSNSYLVDASKIIEGKENDMGILNFTFDPKKNDFIFS